MDAGSDNVSNAIRKHREFHTSSNIRFFKNMEPLDFLKLIKNAKCLVGNSSVGIRESSFLGIPVVNVGSRQDGRMKGKNVIDCGYEQKKIKAALEVQLKHGAYDSQMLYGDGFAGERIAEVLATCELSYDKKINY